MPPGKKPMYSQQQIEDAAQDLEIRSLKATTDAVRELLGGGGSSELICRTLRERRTRLNAMDPEKSLSPQFMTSVHELLSQNTKQVNEKWAAAVKTEQDQLTYMEGQARKLEVDLQELTSAHEQLSSTHGELIGQFKHQSAEWLNEKAQVTALRTERDGHLNSLAIAEHELARLRSVEAEANADRKSLAKQLDTQATELQDIRKERDVSVGKFSVVKEALDSALKKCSELEEKLRDANASFIEVEKERISTYEKLTAAEHEVDLSNQKCRELESLLEAAKAAVSCQQRPAPSAHGVSGFEDYMDDDSPL